ncbi:MarR family winged helix-turn-helix transcriptional regulator [Paenibacillus cymbidii]|uniref:MarR family winged helix-turn-helix transcriptional regulator n=1 Tax=Paenibacillus cymbidii TaxID=1639034 RepID=UPI001080975E|nr:MarR family transcriptional regulator [Paenibacillus cymbidii]
MPPHSNETENVALSLKLMVVLSKAQKSVLDKASKDIRRYGMSPTEFGILEVLYAKGRIPLQQIGDKMLITSGTMTYNIDKLAGKGLLKRVPCQEDRRVIYAELTEEGRALLDRIFPQHAEAMHRLMSVLTPEQQQTAIDLLKILGKGVQEHDN